MSVLERLTEGIVERNLGQEGAALLKKWERTGLLEGVRNDHEKQTMARLLENQARELLRESSTMAAGDVEGFAAVAFPIVRRVFGGLIANDLVSVQPMSLPSGLIFFLDFKYSPDAGGNASGGDFPRVGVNEDTSLYGGGRVGAQITGGVDLTPSGSTVAGAGASRDHSFYNLGSGYSSPTGSTDLSLTCIASGTLGAVTSSKMVSLTHASIGASTVTTSLEELCRYDPDLSGSVVTVCTAPGVAGLAQMNRLNLIALQPAAGDEIDVGKAKLVRRLTHLRGKSAAAATTSPEGLSLINATDTSLVFVFEAGTGIAKDTLKAETAGTMTVDFPIDDDFIAGPSVGSVVGDATWGLEANPDIPEIDIDVSSVAITAMTKKLKAKWSPELGQDLNAYHNLDAEVELTGILSEQVALEIDREILNDLVQGAAAGTYYWSRRPGRFTDRVTGRHINVLGEGTSATDVGGPEFTGNVSEWYETLVETINDVSAQIHRKTLRGGANFLVVSPEVANILEFTSGFRASVTHDDDKGSVGAVKAGSISKKWDVWVDPYFPRNVILVGRRGSSFLESGYVYAPYVPLQMTPTIFGPEDFVPRKGVMTRYAKKMVRPDMYGVVVVQNLLG